MNNIDTTYIYELSINNVPFYIGKTKNPNDRLRIHKKTYGKNIELTIIDSINSFEKKDWKPLETFWITQYKSWGFNLLNKNEGGGGRKAFINDWKEYLKEYQKTDKHKEYLKKYYLKNKSHIKEYNKTDKAKEYLKLYMKKYSKTDTFKEGIKKYSKTDKYLEYQRQWRQRKKDNLNK